MNPDPLCILRTFLWDILNSEDRLPWQSLLRSNVQLKQLIITEMMRKKYICFISKIDIHTTGRDF